MTNSNLINQRFFQDGNPMLCASWDSLYPIHVLLIRINIATCFVVNPSLQFMNNYTKLLKKAKINVKKSAAIKIKNDFSFVLMDSYW